MQNTGCMCGLFGVVCCCGRHGCGALDAYAWNFGSELLWPFDMSDDLVFFFLFVL